MRVCVCGCVGVRVCSNVRVVKCSYFFRGKKRYIKTSHLGILERLFEKQFKVPEAAAAKVMGKVKKAAKKYSSASLRNLAQILKLKLKKFFVEIRNMMSSLSFHLNSFQYSAQFIN